jgi:adenylate cyclase
MKNISVTTSFQKKMMVVFSASLVVALLVLGMEQAGLFSPLANRAYDLFFCMKARVTPARPVAPIVVIGVDDKTALSPDFRKPMILWHEDLGRVITSLADHGALVIGCDFTLPDVMFDDYIPGYSKVWLRTFMQTRLQHVPVVTGYMEFPDVRILPDKRYLQIIGSENLGSFNLTTDNDDFIRRHRLFKKNEVSGEVARTFGYAVALAYKPDLTVPEETIYIDYLYPLPAFPLYSLVDVKNKIDAGDAAYLDQVFKGKIVFIGSTNTRDQDHHSTPLNYISTSSKIKVPGVVVHTNIVNTVLAGRFFEKSSLSTRFLLYVLLGVLISCFVLLLGYRGMVAGLPLFLIGYFIICLGLFFQYIILPYVQGSIVLLVCFLLAVFYQSFVVDYEKNRLRSLFGRYLPKEIVDKLLAANDASFFAGETKHLCILFSDIRGFTSYSENREPAEIVQRLNEYFEAMSAEVVAEGGIVDKYIGDGMLAFFGVLDPQQNPSAAGMKAALRMEKRLEDLNRKWLAEGGAPFKIGVGLHTGDVMVGNIGSRSKTEFTVIGDVVNLASRLEGKTKEFDATVIISEAVYQQEKDHIVVEEKGVVPIKGRLDERIYHLLEYRG